LRTLLSVQGGCGAAPCKSCKVYSAGNLKNASPGPSICAKSAAVAKALSEGERDFEALAIVGEAEGPVSPCGVCQQTLIEFGEDTKVIMANVKGDVCVATDAELLPAAFTGKYIDAKKLQPHSYFLIK